MCFRVFEEACRKHKKVRFDIFGACLPSGVIFFCEMCRGQSKNKTQWRIPKSKQSCVNMVEAKTAGKSCRSMLKQALEGRKLQTDARFLLDDGSIVYGHRVTMSAR